MWTTLSSPFTMRTFLLIVHGVLTLKHFECIVQCIVHSTSEVLNYWISLKNFKLILSWKPTLVLYHTQTVASSSVGRVCPQIKMVWHRHTHILRKILCFLWNFERSKFHDPKLITLCFLEIDSQTFIFFIKIFLDLQYKRRKSTYLRKAFSLQVKKIEFSQHELKIDVGATVHTAAFSGGKKGTGCNRIM